MLSFTHHSCPKTYTNKTLLHKVADSEHFFTWCALPNYESAQAGVETDVVGVSIAGGHHHQPVPALLPSLWFGIPTPGSILVGPRIFSFYVHPRPGNVLELTAGTVTFGEKTK